MGAPVCFWEYSGCKKVGRHMRHAHRGVPRRAWHPAITITIGITIKIMGEATRLRRCRSSA
jgi:hypothetical protein